jgi:hypothetical protein
MVAGRVSVAAVFVRFLEAYLVLISYGRLSDRVRLPALKLRPSTGRDRSTLFSDAEGLAA